MCLHLNFDWYQSGKLAFSKSHSLESASLLPSSKYLSPTEMAEVHIWDGWEKGTETSSSSSIIEDAVKSRIGV